MSELRQAANGKWNIVDICHDQAGITIPAKFTYNGVTKSFNITTQKKTIATEWETPVGQAISLDDITRVYTEVKVGNKIYRVIIPENFDIVRAEGGDEPVQVPTITSFVVNPISLPAAGGDINYTVTTNPSNATVRIKCTSFSATKSTKTGKFSVPANTDGPNPKTFTLSAWCVDNASAIHTKNVTQSKQTEPVEDEFSVTQIQDTFHYGGETTSMTFQIINPQGHGWTASTVPSWVHLSDTSGVDTTYIDVEVDERTDGGTNQRIGQITITDNDTRKTYTVTVTQDGFVPELTLTAVDNPIPATATALTYNIKSNTDVTVKYGAEQKTHEASQSTTDGFTIEPNETIRPISHTITAFCTNYPTVEKTVTITQQGKEEEEDQFNVTQLSGYIFPYTGGTKNGFFTITNPQGHSWTATCPDTWVLVGKRSGSNGGPINVTVTERDDTFSHTRLSIITVKDLSTNKTYSINVEQAGVVHSTCKFIFELTGNSFLTNSSQYPISLADDDSSNAFTMIATAQTLIHTGFEGHADSNMQQVQIRVTNNSEQFEIEFDDDESKQFQMRYVFAGTRDQNIQNINVDVTFKNLTTPSMAPITITLPEGSSGSNYRYLDVEDWFVPNGDVRVEVSFHFHVTNY